MYSEETVRLTKSEGSKTEHKNTAHHYSTNELLIEAVNEVLPTAYDPRFLVKGGEKMVFYFNEPFQRKPKQGEAARDISAKERARDVVYKVNFLDMVPIIKALAAKDDAKLAKALEKVRIMIEGRRKEISGLREYFGYDAVPAYQFMIREVPISEAIVAAVEPKSLQDASGIRSIPAWVEVQRKLDLSEGLSLHGYYPESDRSRLKMNTSSDEYSAVYDEAHDVLTGGPLSKEDTGSQVQKVLDMYPDLKGVADVANRDGGFKQALREASEKLIDYINDTGMAIDMAGSMNIMMFRESGKWKIKFLDAFPPGEYSFKNFKAILEMKKQGSPLGLRARIVALNLANTVRVVNALALISGSSQRLYFDGLRDIPPEDWRKEMDGLFNP